MISKPLAEEFFAQLQTFSQRYLSYEVRVGNMVSSWGAGWDEHPSGLVVHFTADEDFNRVLRWFLIERYKSRVSAHTVVADRKLGCHSRLAHDLPLIESLSTTVIQCRPPSLSAWHATWANGAYYGIECVNAGELHTQDATSFFSWRPKDKDSEAWTTPWVVPYKDPVKLYGRWWEPYTQAQVATVCDLAAYYAAYCGGLNPARIIGHENLNSNKSDPGPAFPIEGLRYCVKTNQTVDSCDWFTRYCTDLGYGESIRDDLVAQWVSQLDGNVCDDIPVDVAWDRFSSAIAASIEKEGSNSESILGLQLLGYGVESASELQESIRIFQRMCGLTIDAVLGVQTKTALFDRLVDRGMLHV